MTARDTIALKPCPFCGNRNVAQGASGGYISVWCFCGARGPDVPFPENCDPLPPIKECHAAWNRRAEPASIVPTGGVEAEPKDGEWREVEIAHLLKGRRRSPAYFPTTGETCEVSGPNQDDDNGYTWGATVVLWQNDIFVLYGRKGFWPILHKHEHVLFRPVSRPKGGA